jgi:hypothetical protein
MGGDFTVPPDNTTFHQALNGGFDVTVYDPGSPFAPVPETSTLALLASSLGALAAWKKCRGFPTDSSI